MKSQFTTPLLAMQLNESDWQLVADFCYDSEHLNRTIVVPTGFVTDFASVPRIPFAYWLVGGVGNRAAAIHDDLYRSCLLGDDGRKDADETFLEALGVLGIAGWRCHGMYAGVRAFGWKFYCKESNSQMSGIGNSKMLGLKPPPPVKASMIRSVEGAHVNDAHRGIKELL